MSHRGFASAERYHDAGIRAAGSKQDGPQAVHDAAGGHAPGWMARLFGKAGRDIEGTILGAPAEGTRNYVRGHPEGDSVSGQAGKGEATPVVLPFPFLRAES